VTEGVPAHVVELHPLCQCPAFFVHCDWVAAATMDGSVQPPSRYPADEKTALDR
jgi:hypothetical protein